MERARAVPAASFCCGLVLALGLFSALLLALNIGQLVPGDTEEISVGLLFDFDTEKSFAEAAELAMKDIAKASQERFPLSRQTKITIHRRQRSETAEAAYRRLHQAGVTTFVAGAEVEAAAAGRDSVLLAPPRLQPRPPALAAAYLGLINATVEGELVTIATISSGDQAAASLLAALEAAVARYPRLRLGPAILHTRTRDPGAEAARVARSLQLAGPHCALLLSPDILPEVASAARTSRGPQPSRWFAVAASHLAPQLEAAVRGQALRLTTLAWLGGAGEEEARQRYLARAGQEAWRTGRVYAAWLVYREVWRRLGPPPAPPQAQGAELLVSLSLKAGAGLVTVPALPWLVGDIVTLARAQAAVTPVPSLTVPPATQLRGARCAAPQLRYSAPGGLYLPATVSVTAPLSSAVLVPLVARARLELQCGPRLLRLHCPAPAPRAQGRVSCVVGAGRSSRRRRGTVATPPGLASVVTQAEAGLAAQLREAARNMEAIVDSWRLLTPKVVGCFSSVAGR